MDGRVEIKEEAVEEAPAGAEGGPLRGPGLFLYSFFFSFFVRSGSGPMREHESKRESCHPFAMEKKKGFFLSFTLTLQTLTLLAFASHDGVLLFFFFSSFLLLVAAAAEGGGGATCFRSRNSPASSRSLCIFFVFFQSPSSLRFPVCKGGKTGI